MPPKQDKPPEPDAPKVVGAEQKDVKDDKKPTTAVSDGPEISVTFTRETKPYSKSKSLADRFKESQVPPAHLLESVLGTPLKNPPEVFEILLDGRMVRVPTINGMAPVAFRGEAVVFAQLPDHVKWRSASPDKTQVKLSLGEAQQELESITKKLDAFDHTNGDPKSAVEMLATQKQVKSRLEDVQKQFKTLEGRQWSDYLAIQQTMELHWGLNEIDDRLYELRPAAHKPETKEIQHLFTCTGLNQMSTSTSTSEGQDVKDQDTVVIPMKDLATTDPMVKFLKHIELPGQFSPMCIVLGTDGRVYASSTMGYVEIYSQSGDQLDSLGTDDGPSNMVFWEDRLLVDKRNEWLETYALTGHKLSIALATTEPVLGLAADNNILWVACPGKVSGYCSNNGIDFELVEQRKLSVGQKKLQWAIPDSKLQTVTIMRGDKTDRTIKIDGKPVHCAPGPQGLIMATRSEAGCVSFLDTNDGKITQSFGSPGSGDGQLKEPTCACWLPNIGQIWVADNGNKRISVWSAPP